MTETTMPADPPTTVGDREGWGWNGDMCAVWGQAIVLGETAGEKEARARLFDASSDLLAALETVVSVADRKTVEFDQARAAIAKAKGSAQNV